MKAKRHPPWQEVFVNPGHLRLRLIISANLVPIRRKRNSSPATTESPYFVNPSDCCPSGHHQGNMMNPSHEAMMGGGMMHHPMMQQHQQQQHFSPGGGNTNRCCAGCGSKIVDRFLLHAMDRYWHNACLKCSCCQATLADIGSSCFTKGGMILCKHDYIKLYGMSGACSGCQQMIPASEYVMRAQGNVYHVKCFACVKCHNQLVAGDRYNLVNGSILCEQDCIKMLKGTAATVGGTVRKNSKMRMNAAIKV